MSTRLVSRAVCGLFMLGMALCIPGVPPVSAQELGGAGTIQGTVKDPTGAVMVAVTVTLANPVSGFHRETTTDSMGKVGFGGDERPRLFPTRAAN